MKLRRLIIPLTLATSLLCVAPPPAWGGGSDIILENQQKSGSSSLDTKSTGKKSAAVTPSFSGSSRAAAPSPRELEQRQSWTSALRDMLRYLLGDAFPFLNGRLR